MKRQNVEGREKEQSNAKYKTSIVGLQCNLRCGEQRKKLNAKENKKNVESLFLSSTTNMNLIVINVRLHFFSIEDLLHTEFTLIAETFCFWLVCFAFSLLLSSLVP